MGGVSPSRSSAAGWASDGRPFIGRVELFRSDGVPFCLMDRKDFRAQALRKIK